MITSKDIDNFFSNLNYDIRISSNGRWIDQKCTPDVVTIVADCIYNYYTENNLSTFTTKDIWFSNYAVENVELIFKKPSTINSSAKNEYDKFFQQPMEMLACAGILLKDKVKNKNVYTIIQYDILEYIALREKNSLFFIKNYIEKTLRDSGIWEAFKNFFNNQTKNNFITIKNQYSSFIIKNTKINKTLECNRIFTKVLNPLAYHYNSLGTERGNLSKHNITYDMLMYNRLNFRDTITDKPKNITRMQYLSKNPIKIETAYSKYLSVKSKNFLRIFNEKFRNSKTEHLEDRHYLDNATHMHHIFPEAYFPEISHYIENIIALTPTQHLNYAHPNGKTNEIDEQYQHLLLLSKTARIRENIFDENTETIYSFSDLAFVLYIGFDDSTLLTIDYLDFGTIIKKINLYFSLL